MRYVGTLLFPQPHSDDALLTSYPFIFISINKPWVQTPGALALPAKRQIPHGIDQHRTLFRRSRLPARAQQALPAMPECRATLFHRPAHVRQRFGAVTLRPAAGRSCIHVNGHPATGNIRSAKQQEAVGATRRPNRLPFY